MRILVTGGAGFLGSNLCRALLARDEEVIVLDNFSTSVRSNISELNVEIIRHDVVEPFHIECDEIYHLACPASPPAYQLDPVKTVITAVAGTKNALACAEENCAKIVVASSSEVYGEPLQHPQTEELWAHVNPVGTRSCYDTGKAACESLAAAYYSERGVETKIARIHNTYGPWMDPDDGRVVSNFICQALQGEDLTVYGQGLQTRSFCYVSDMVAGLIGLMDNELGLGLPVNLGRPEENTIRELADTILVITQSDSKLAYEELPDDDPTRRLPDIGFAKRMFGFQPVIGLAEGIYKTTEYFRGVLDIHEVNEPGEGDMH